MRTVEQVMTRKVATVQSQTSFQQVVPLLEEWRVSAAQVLDQHGRLLGVLSEADLACKQVPQPGRRS
jgi:CBS-domain-containing membrane protein